jgi:TonB family protein
MRWSLALALALLAGCAQPWIVAKKVSSSASSEWTYTEDVTSAERLIKAVAIHAPNPNRQQLARAHTVKVGRVGTYEGAVRFCVRPRGTVRSDGMATPTGDAGLDHVLRQQVERWRFKPAILAGRPIEACSTVRFVVRFE